MLTDSLLNFVAPGSPLSLVLGVGVGAASNVIDLLGSGSGTAPANIIGNASLFGADVGIGLYRPLINIVTGTAFATADGATLNVEFQAAPDTGSGYGYVPGAWKTLEETGYMPVADLAAGTVIGRFSFPPAIPANFRPRFLRLFFQPLAATQFTAGTIASAVVTMARDDQANRFTPRNFAVA
ncbi:MAG TPA: hypothetical protein PLO16_12670 [Acidocella sp.]|nr:hypothetical protein [Acidocella sp.]